ncbi:MAG: uridine kinase, partial [Candidatus Eisenbacteria bacterium]|nr:uridine kinase [Candidatus Eisenbacteria bacterium]
MGASHQVVIGIAGGTGSGKTTVARIIASCFPSGTAVILSHDSYYHDHSSLTEAQRRAINYDHPKAFDTDLLIDQLIRLRAGDCVERPEYDYKTHSRLPSGVTIRPAGILLVEGILVLEHKALRDLMDIKLFIDTDGDERFIRRLRRDIEDRGRSISSVIEQYLGTVKPMHLDFVEPSKRYADVIIPEGAHNRVAIDLVVSRIRAMLEERVSREREPGVPS